jgi:hypothetical protein
MRLLPRLVLGLLLVLPTLVHAQAADAPVVSPEASTPPLVTAPPESQAPPSAGEIIPHRMKQERPNLVVPRVILGVLLGTAAATGGTVLGFLAGTQLTTCDVFDDICNGSDLVVLAAPMLLGATAFSTLTVYGLGSLLKGRGTLFSTLVGSVAGAGLGLVLLGTAGYAGLALMPPLAAIGALIAYEISDSSWEPEPSQALSASSPFQLIPVLGVTPGGGVLGGLTGRF